MKIKKIFLTKNQKMYIQSIYLTFSLVVYIK